MHAAPPAAELARAGGPHSARHCRPGLRKAPSGRRGVDLPNDRACRGATPRWRQEGPGGSRPALPGTTASAHVSPWDRGVRLAQNAAQTPDTTFPRHKSARRRPPHRNSDTHAPSRCSWAVTVHTPTVVAVPSPAPFAVQRGSRRRLVSGGQRCCRRPGGGDVVHGATAGSAARVRRGRAGAGPMLRCRWTPRVTVCSSCCSGRNGSLPGKPLTGGTRAAPEALAAGPHTGTGPRGQVL